MQVGTRSLGDVLVGDGWVSAEQLAWARRVAGQTGVRYSGVLVAAGLVRRDEMYRLLARVWGSDFVDLTATSLDRRLLEGLDPHRLGREGWYPVRLLDEDAGGRHRAPVLRRPVLVATSERPTAELHERVEEALGRPVRLEVTTDWDILQALHRGFREAVVEQATLGLWRRDRAQSARQVLFTGQRVVLWLLVALLVAGLVLATRATVTALMAVVSVAFLASVVFKFVVCMVGARQERRVPVTDAEVAALDPRELPVYTVLVPVYKEANVVADLIGNLGGLDYPREKLEILLLLEEEAARASNPPSTITFLIIPPGTRRPSRRRATWGCSSPAASTW